MKCKDVMTKYPIICTTSVSVQEAAKVMKNEDTGFVPVIDDRTQKLVGVVTDRDLCLEIIAGGRNPQQVKVSEVMTINPVTCKAEDDIQKVEELMRKHQVRRIPVVDQNGYCVGIISQADIALKLGKSPEVAEVVQEISKPGRFACAACAAEFTTQHERNIHQKAHVAAA